MLPLYAFMDKQEKHSMQRRSPGNNYTHPGIYHITITISDRKAQSLGRVIGDVQYPDGNPNAPRVELTAIGKMVEYELLHSISYHYPFIEVQDYVIMPEHMHFILNSKTASSAKTAVQHILARLSLALRKAATAVIGKLLDKGR